jgi:hypothetical protein
METKATVIEIKRSTAENSFERFISDVLPPLADYGVSGMRQIESESFNDEGKTTLKYKIIGAPKAAHPRRGFSDYCEVLDSFSESSAATRSTPATCFAAKPAKRSIYRSKSSVSGTPRLKSSFAAPARRAKSKN